MEKVFSDKTEEGIRLIWMQFDPEKTAEGVRLLREAADAGDPDALCFLARTYMGERYVWEYAALEINGEKAVSLLKAGIRRGSACAVLLAMRCGELTPSARKAMPFASLKEAREEALKHFPAFGLSGYEYKSPDALSGGAALSKHTQRIIAHFVDKIDWKKVKLL